MITSILGVLCQRPLILSLFTVVSPQTYCTPNGRLCGFRSDPGQADSVAFKTKSKSSGKWVLPITLTKTQGNRFLYEIYVIDDFPVESDRNMLSFIINNGVVEWVQYVDANGGHPYLNFINPVNNTMFIGVDVDAHTFFVSDGSTLYADLPMTPYRSFNGFIVKCRSFFGGTFEGSVEAGDQNVGDYTAV